MGFAGAGMSMAFWERLLQSIKFMTIMDVLDILIVTFLLYYLFKLIRNTNAERLLKGIFVLLVIMQISGWLKLEVINFLLTTVMQVGFIAIVIVFQPELRKILEQFGRSHFGGRFKLYRNKDYAVKLQQAVVQVVEAVSVMSWSKTGALIVFENMDGLGSISETGTELDALVSSELVQNVFYNKSPLHDGAVVISKGRLQAAGCLLPLSANRNISKELGTRHRAAIGVTEAYDCPCVVVSEETGAISFVSNGVIKRHLAPETLERLLLNELLAEDDDDDKKGFRLFRGKAK